MRLTECRGPTGRRARLERASVFEHVTLNNIIVFKNNNLIKKKKKTFLKIILKPCTVVIYYAGVTFRFDCWAPRSDSFWSAVCPDVDFIVKTSKIRIWIADFFLFFCLSRFVHPGVFFFILYHRRYRPVIIIRNHSSGCCTHSADRKSRGGKRGGKKNIKYTHMYRQDACEIFDCRGGIRKMFCNISFYPGLLLRYYRERKGMKRTDEWITGHYKESS